MLFRSSDTIIFYVFRAAIPFAGFRCATTKEEEEEEEITELVLFSREIMFFSQTKLKRNNI